MISYNVYKEYAAGKHYVEAWGLSTDSKPTTGIANGSLFIEMDSKKVYFFDETNATWRQFS